MTDPRPDLSTLQAAADAGDARAQYQYALALIGGQAGAPDPEQARHWLEKAADNDYPRALSALGAFNAHGIHVPMDLDKARTLLERALDKGILDAAYHLGELHASHRGERFQPEQARRYLQQAAKDNHPGALCQLAYCLEQGIGGAAFPVKATQCFAAAAAHQSPRALQALAWRYEVGHTLPQDPGKAIALYLKAAGLGFIGAADEAARLSAESDPAVANQARELAGGKLQIDMPSESFDTPLPSVTVEVVSWQPRAFLLRNIVSVDEAGHLMNLAAPNLKPSQVVTPGQGQVKMQIRTSHETRFQPEIRDLVINHIERRLAAHSHHPVENGENLLILRYRPGEEYKPHFDYFDPKVFANSEALSYGGQRVATLLTYLNRVPEGGGTYFPNAGLEVVPEKGAALLFYNVLPDGSVDPMSRHAGQPVIRGEKWAMSRWIRAGDAYGHLNVD